MSTDNLWNEYDGKGFAAIHSEYAVRASKDEDGNEITTTYATKNDIPTVMTGATSQAAGTSGLVPAPTVEEKDKFLKGDGTWTAPPEVNLANYYYDEHGNGLSAKRTNGARPYGSTSLVGGGGNMNTYDLAATFFIDWGGSARHFFTVNTVDSGASRIGFGTNSDHSSAMRYLLPTPVANKYAKTNAEGKIVWGDIPSLPSPSIDDSLLLGQSDGSQTWTALERDTFGSITDDNDGSEIQDEEGNSIGDENSVELWTSFNGTGFGAERAVADVDGNPLNLTISDNQVIAIGGKSIGGGTVVDTYTKAETDVLLADKADKSDLAGKADKSELPILRQDEASENTTINVVNNRVTWVSNITYSTMTFNVAVPSGDAANFAVELLSQHACTVSVTVNGVQVPKASAAINELEAGKTYQLTCVGYGWACVEVDVPSYTVTIDNKTYGATRLGNHLWTTENLDYVFTGCTLNGTPEDKPMAWNNSADPTYEGKYGIVYNYKAVLYLAEHADELLPSGWRLPTLDDWRQLGATIGWDPTQSGQMVTGDKANAFRNTEWYLYNSVTRLHDIPGTNLYGLNVLPAGSFLNGEFYNIGEHSKFWSSDSLDLSVRRLWFTSVFTTYSWSYVEASLGSELLYTYGVHIRLIKDI